MKELTDYSGEFIPKITFEHLPKDVIIELMKELSRFYVKIDLLWYNRVAKEVSPDKALSWCLSGWEKMGQIEMKSVRELLKIEGNDVEAFFKIFQLAPGFPLALMEYDMELKTKNDGLLTITRCPVADYWERQGEKGVEELYRICRDLETEGFKAYAAQVNPDIKVTNFKMPPRKSKDEITCQWQFKIED